jgi:hypothetical protein
MEDPKTISPAERAYAAVVAVMVPLFFALIWFSSYSKNGGVDTALMKTEAMYFLAYVGTISIAVWVGNSILRRLTAAFRSELPRSLVRFGVPLFLFTTTFNFIFPSHISFAEHVCFNLMLALFASWAWKHQRTPLN